MRTFEGTFVTFWKSYLRSIECFEVHIDVLFSERYDKPLFDRMVSHLLDLLQISIRMIRVGSGKFITGGTKIENL